MKISQRYDEILSDLKATQELYNKIKPDLQEPILECACGSGDLLLLIQEDLLATGIDFDKDMLQLAKDKGCQNLFLKDMTQLDFNKDYKTVLCFGDSLNYLNEKQIPDFFRGVYESLMDDGLFIVDMHHLERLNEFKEPYIEEADMGSYQYQWTIQSDQNQLHHQFVFYQDNDTMIDTVVQTVFTPKFIKQHLQNSGFRIGKEEVDSDFEKVTYWCHKEAI